MNENMWTKKQKQKQKQKQNKKTLISKFQLIPILRFWVMQDYVCFIAPID